jgi:alkanesulfonate monooxygenase SsuD/methylene tetrahydromethanopterin reductase-like flavin-dependent oxidoreductase (luciferase family)
VSANDHLVWQRPWLDGPTVLAAVASAARDTALATTVTLPVVRHPVVVAKTLSTLAALAEGPVIAGLGPGSSAADYAAVGVPFDERWRRFDEALPLVRALVRGETAPAGRFYGEPPRLDPVPERPPQVWFGSWGSEQRFAALAAAADGWFASAYNATPDQFAAARARLDGHLRAAGRDPATFPDAVATTWTYVTDRRRDADDVLTGVLAPTLRRDPGTLTGLPIGSPEHCAEVLSRYAAAGAREILLWPLRGGIPQLERCAALVG